MAPCNITEAGWTRTLQGSSRRPANRSDVGPSAQMGMMAGS